MPSTTPSTPGRKRNRTRQSQQSNTIEVRNHYQSYRVRRRDHWYNPLLDDPNHPANWRKLAHGTPGGYDLGMCRCPPGPDDPDGDRSCKTAGKKLNDARVQRRVDKRRADHGRIITQTLGAHGIDTDLTTPAALDAAAALVLDTGLVTNRYQAKISYTEGALANALYRWRQEHDLTSTIDDAQLVQVAAALTERLQS